MIGSALVGTFLGILLAYGFVESLGGLLEQKVEDGSKELQCIKTMGAISEPPEVLGGMIGSALVGTFLGVFLAYGIVGPLGTRLKAVVDEDALFYHVIRDILVAHLHGNAAQVSVEIGRGSVPSEYQPSFQELEASLNNIPPEGA